MMVVRILPVLLALLAIILPTRSGLASDPQQPAYITNAYFSDRLLSEGNVLRPNSVVSVLPAGASGVNGFFIMDVALVQRGSHVFQIDILDQDGEKLADMAYDPVDSIDDDHIYTVVGSLAGQFPVGWLFFKVYDQINSGPRRHISTFYIMTRDPADVEEPVLADASPDPLATPSPPERDQPPGLLESFRLTVAGLMSGEPEPGPEEPPRQAEIPSFPGAGAPETPWFIYLGSYADPRNATHVAERVIALGISVFHQKVEVRNSTFARVNAGPFADREQARQALTEIEENTGIRGTIRGTGPEQRAPNASASAPSGGQSSTTDLPEGMVRGRPPVPLPESSLPEGMVRGRPQVALPGSALPEGMVRGRPPVPLPDAEPPEAAYPAPLNQAPPSSPAGLGPIDAASSARAIYVGSFRDLTESRRIQQRLRSMELPVFTQETVIGRQPFSRLFVGPFDDPARLSTALIQIKTSLDIDGVPVAESGPSGEQPRGPVTPLNPRAGAPTPRFGTTADPTPSPPTPSVGVDASPAPPAARVGAETPPSSSSPSTPTTPMQTPTPSAADGPLYGVQMLSFSNRGNADRHQGKLTQLGFPVFQEHVRVNGRPFHRTVLGPFGTRSQAMEAAHKAAVRAGHGGSVREFTRAELARLGMRATDQRPTIDPSPTQVPSPSAPSATTPTAPARPSPSSVRPARIGDGEEHLVQLVSYLDRGMAEEMRDRLGGMGLPSFFQTTRVAGRELITVMAGPFSSRAVADAARGRIEQETTIQGELTTRMASDSTQASHSPPIPTVSAPPVAPTGGPPRPEPTLSPPSRPTPGPPAGASSEGAMDYMVYVGFFSQSAIADATMAKLAAAGLAMIKQQVNVRGRRLFSLCAGPFSTQPEAERAREVVRDLSGVERPEIRDSTFSGRHVGQGCGPGH